jgi:hypothetical protein
MNQKHKKKKEENKGWVLEKNFVEICFRFFAKRDLRM